MTEKMSHATLLQAMESRFDYQSARNILAALLDELELAGKPDFGQAEIGRIGEVVRLRYPGADRVLRSFASFFEPEAAPAPPVVVAPPQPAPPPAPVAEVVVEPAAPAVVVAEEAKPAAAAEAKDEKKKKK